MLSKYRQDDGGGRALSFFISKSITIRGISFIDSYVVREPRLVVFESHCLFLYGLQVLIANVSGTTFATVSCLTRVVCGCVPSTAGIRKRIQSQEFCLFPPSRSPSGRHGRLRS